MLAVDPEAAVPPAPTDINAAVKSVQLPSKDDVRSDLKLAAASGALTGDITSTATGTASNVTTDNSLTAMLSDPTVPIEDLIMTYMMSMSQSSETDLRNKLVEASQEQAYEDARDNAQDAGQPIPTSVAPVASGKSASVFDSVTDLYEKTNADLVIVAVFETAMNQVSKKCFEFPWVVFLEKPPGFNLGDAEDIAACADKRNRTVLVGLNRRFLSSTRAVLDDLKVNSGPGIFIFRISKT